MGMLRMLPERAAVSLISAFPSWTATWEPQLKKSRKPAANDWSEANTHPALLTLMLPIRTDTSSSWLLIEATKRRMPAEAAKTSRSGKQSSQRDPNFGKNFGP